MGREWDCRAYAFENNYCMKYRWLIPSLFLPTDSKQKSRKDKLLASLQWSKTWDCVRNSSLANESQWKLVRRETGAQQNTDHCRSEWRLSVGTWSLSFEEPDGQGLRRRVYEVFLRRSESMNSAFFLQKEKDVFTPISQNRLWAWTQQFWNWVF